MFILDMDLQLVIDNVCSSLFVLFITFSIICNSRTISYFVNFISTGNMAAFDMNDPKSIVSPGGVGFDINCGVRLLRTNLFEKDVQPIKVSQLMPWVFLD